MESLEAQGATGRRGWRREVRRQDSLEARGSRDWRREVRRRLEATDVSGAG